MKLLFFTLCPIIIVSISFFESLTSASSFLNDWNFEPIYIFSFLSSERTINSNKANKIETSKIIKLKNTIFGKDLKSMLPFSGYNE